VSSYTITTIVFVCLFWGSIFGMWLGHRLPEHHRTAESHDAVKLITGMLSVLAALVLGFLIASVKNGFDNTDSQIRHFAATLILLNETLKDYGLETEPARDLLRRYTARAIDDNWPADRSTPVQVEDRQSGALLDSLRLTVLALPADEPLRAALRTDAAALVESALETRWLSIESVSSSIQPAFMAILIAWITLIFISFGYNAPRNTTVAITFGLGAMALASCIFLIIEMDGAFDGLITVSSAPMHRALEHMNP
jgi:hypothetical protein